MPLELSTSLFYILTVVFQPNSANNSITGSQNGSETLQNYLELFITIYIELVGLRNLSV